MERQINTDDFTQEAECFYRDEKYSVRDNGAVMRHQREGGRSRSIDNQWTFGKPKSKTGYMEIAGVRVHRIVATAFHGEPPDETYVVDHIDTNRQNNRPENLRWLIRLENALKNPITRKRIEIICGCRIENFLADPAKYRDRFKEPNFKWMQTISAEESKECLERIQIWADSDEVSAMNRVPWEFIWRGRMNFSRDLLRYNEQMSNSRNAAQRNWFIPAEFPCCPETAGKNPMKTYAENLKIGTIFYRNESNQAIVSDFAISVQRQSLYVLVERTLSSVNDTAENFKPWALIEITYVEGPYVYMHETIEKFSTKEEAGEKFNSTD